jgi:hypothetical protein
LPPLQLRIRIGSFAPIMVIQASGTATPKRPLLGAAANASVA